MSLYFVSPHAEYKAGRIAQMLTEKGHDPAQIYARPTGETMIGAKGHLFLLDLNELGQLYRVDAVDVVHPKPPPAEFVIE